MGSRDSEFCFAFVTSSSGGSKPTSGSCNSSRTCACGDLGSDVGSDVGSRDGLLQFEAHLEQGEELLVQGGRRRVDLAVEELEGLDDGGGDAWSEGGWRR